MTHPLNIPKDGVSTFAHTYTPIKVTDLSVYLTFRNASKIPLEEKCFCPFHLTEEVKQPHLQHWIVWFFKSQGQLLHSLTLLEHSTVSGCGRVGTVLMNSQMKFWEEYSSYSKSKGKIFTCLGSWSSSLEKTFRKRHDWRHSCLI